MVGFVVTPTTASSLISRLSSPLSSIVRESESIQTDWPRLLSLCRFDSAIAHLPFHRFNFFQSLYITIAAVESCREERAHKLDRETRADHFGAEAEDVHVVVLDALVRGIDVVADRSADATHLRGGNRSADAGAADEDAPLRPAALDRLAELTSLVRVVDPHRIGIGPEVDDLVPSGRKRLEHLLAQVHAAVVKRNANDHETVTTSSRNIGV